MKDRHSELRVLRWADRINDVLKGEVRGPVRANIDLTNLCSHKCFFCEPVAFREETIRDKRHTLSLDVALQTINDLAAMDCRAIVFSGGGEPTLHPHFGVLLQRAKMAKMRTSIVTHGGYLEKWKKEVLTCADHIRVSVDASCEREHREMHGAKEGEFALVVSGIRSVLTERPIRYVGPEVGLAYIVADCNSSPESLHRFLKLATDLEVDYVQFRPVSEETPQALTQDWPILADRIADLRACFPWLEILVVGHRLTDVFLQREFDRCYAALTLAVISANGEVCACCDERSMVFGNVNEKPFRDIWLSETHREKAKRIVPKLCGRCLQCGTNRGIQKYVVENQAVPELI